MFEEQRVVTSDEPSTSPIISCTAGGVLELRETMMQRWEKQEGEMLRGVLV